MTDDPILTYLKSIDDRGQRLEDKVDGFVQKHTDDDAQEHRRLHSRINKLWMWITLGGSGAIGASKSGLTEKVMSIFGGGS